MKLSHPPANGEMLSAGNSGNFLYLLSEVEFELNIWQVSSGEEISGISSEIAAMFCRR